MNRFTVLTALIFSLFLALPAQENGPDYSDEYGAAAEALDVPFFKDLNTGTTAFPLLQIPMGGVYESMGTAVTAVSLDASIMAANPAVTSVLNATELSFFHNNWIDDVNVESLVYAGRFGNLGVGAYANFLYLPFREWNDWAERGAGGYYSEILGTVNVSYNFLSSYYFHGLSVGANLRGAYRHLPAAIGTNNPGQDKLTIMADIGLLTKFNFGKFYVSRDKNFSVGAAVKNLGIPITYDHSEAASNSPEALPSEVSFGVSYQPVRPLMLSLDFNYPFSIVPGIVAMKWNLAAGLNLSVADFLSFQGGFRYDGENPRFSLGSKIDLDWINFLINYTLDLTTQFTSPFDRLSIQAQLDFGDSGRQQLQKQVDELFIAGLEAYAIGEILRAIRYWQAAIELDPAYTPAEEYLDIAQTNINLQKQLEDLTKVE